MEIPKRKTLYITLINLFGILFVWLVEVFNSRSEKSLANLISGFFSSGMVITLPILMIIALLDYFYLPKKPKQIYSILTLQWILISLPFIYWSIKNTHNRSLNIIIVFIFLFVQWIKYWVVKRYLPKHTS